MKKALLFASVFVLTVLTAILLFVLPASAASGKWGDLDWTLNETTGELVISGEGEMETLSSDNAWLAYTTSIKNVKIENGVTSISDEAFDRCWSLSSVTIPNSVTSIGDEAFYNCTSLTSVTIPNSVKSISYEAFGNCPSLTSVYISDLANWCGISFGHYSANPLSVNPLSCNLYLNGILVTDLVIPSGVTSIGYCAFEGCKSLTSVTIPNSVTSIGESAFNKCTNLTSITIPNSVTSIDSHAFYGCTSLTSITIPNFVTSIGGEAFCNCTSLTRVTIGNSVKSIGEEAFQGCTSLTSIMIGKSVTSISYKAFRDCTNLTSVTIPNSVTSIASSAFKGCTSLTIAKYFGTQEQWDAVVVGEDNDPLLNALEITGVPLVDDPPSDGNENENSGTGDTNNSGGKSGCGSVVSGGIGMMALIALAGGMIAVKKKK